MEGLFPAGGYSESLERSGPMDTPSYAGHPAQALEARFNHPSGTARSGSAGKCRGTGGGQCPPLVAQQRDAPELGADSGLGQPTGDTVSLLTSTSRTARCGPARRVVWQGRRGNPPPYADTAEMESGHPVTKILVDMYTCLLYTSPSPRDRQNLVCRLLLENKKN